MENFELFKRTDYVKFGFILELGNGNIDKVKANLVNEGSLYRHYKVINKKVMEEIEEALLTNISPQINSLLAHSIIIAEYIEKLFGGKEKLKALFFGTYPVIRQHKTKEGKLMVKAVQYFLVGEYATKKEREEYELDLYTNVEQSRLDELIKTQEENKDELEKYTNNNSGITIINHGQIDIETKETEDVCVFLDSY